MKRPHSYQQEQEQIFASYGWHDRRNLLNIITVDRCDYIEARVERVLGPGALKQQEILEVGSGGGLLCEELSRRGAMMTGIEPSAGALAEARAHAERSGIGARVHYQQGYAESLPYSNGSFSVIICLDVLEHVQDVQKTVQEIARVLAPGGVFIFDTINRTLLARLILIWIGERFFQKSGLVPGLHNYQAFIKPSELRAVLVQNGLHIGEMVGFMPRLKGGRLSLGPGWFKSVSYIGYATKGR